jgi:hypothetical protein
MPINQSAWVVAERFAGSSVRYPVLRINLVMAGMPTAGKYIGRVMRYVNSSSVMRKGEKFRVVSAVPRWGWKFRAFSSN